MKSVLSGSIWFKLFLLGLFVVPSGTVRGATNYVNIASSSPSIPYTSWATASTNIQRAVEQAADGDVVLVAAGHYLLSSEIYVANNITIQSVSGPDVTIVDGAGSSRCFNLDDTSCFISGFTITNGFSSGDGGGIYCTDSSSQVSNSIFSGNSSGGNGGGMHNGSVEHCVFSANSAGGKGGGLYQGLAVHSAFYKNSASDNGGGMNGGIAQNCTFVENVTAMQGGGMNDGIAKSSTFVGNTANHGGGIASSTVNNSVFRNNTSISRGGGMYQGTANNCTFSWNSAGAGGGGINRGSANNCTIIQNSALGDDSKGGGMHRGTANNCIAWYNTSTKGRANLNEVTVNYSCSPDVVHEVSGNITNMPMLVSSSHIATNSPCRAAGNYLYCTGTDMDGEAWLNRPSMGCDEFHGPGSVTGSIQPAVSGPTHVCPGFSATYVTEIPGAVTGSILDFGDGSRVTNAIFPTAHAWNVPGDYDVTLTAFNDDFPAGTTVTQTVRVCSENESAIYVSDLSGNDEGSGLSWSTAKKTIQAGIDAQNVVGGIVLVSNGTYSISSEIVVDKTVQVFGLGEPEDTVVFAANSHRCFDLGSSVCLISGFTVTNGFSLGNGGGIYCETEFQMVTNCIIAGNTAGQGGGMYAGTAMDCTFSDNASTWEGGGMYNGVARNCTFSGNHTASGGGGGMYEGAASNCIFSGNHAATGGGGVNRVIADHCIISGNSCSENGGGVHRGTVNNSRIIGNVANKGGGMYQSTASNSTFSRNYARANGGGVNQCTVNNCNIIGNSAAGNGGGIHLGTVNNCIVWYNTSVGDDADVSESTVNYSCSPDVVHEVSGNITNMPMLVSASHVAANSPCRAAGDHQYCTGTDMDGEVWLAKPSMGCDEFHGPGTVTGSIQPVVSGPAHVCPGFSTTYIPEIQGAVTGNILDFGDGSRVTNAIVPTAHVWNAPGDYNVILTAFNDDFPLGITATQAVHVYSAEESTIYVSDSSGNDDDNGRGWVTAKKTIQAGIDAQNVVGGIVFVFNGTYSISSEIVVDKTVRLFGQGDPADTVVFAVNSNRCFNLGSSECLISGFTVTNGFSLESGGGIYCETDAPVVTNCMIVWNAADQGGGMYFGTAKDCNFIYNSSVRGGGGMYEGAAVNCTFSGNYTDAGGGGVHRVIADHCIISGNSCTGHGGGVNRGTVSNSRIIGNSGNKGGGMYEGTANNCIFSQNSSDAGGGAINRGIANNCSIIGNTALGNNGGGGMHMGTANNCIVWYNTSAGGGTNLHGTAVNYSCSPDVVHEVSGNITNAPAFIDLAGENYRLLSDSPCINWGNNSFASESVDLDGNPRIVEGYADMGAFEYQGIIANPDSDDDGLPDDWERRYFGGNAGVGGNLDGDGKNNGDEYISGCDPSDASSCFIASNTTAEVNGTNYFVVEWEAVSNRVYNVYWSGGLAEGFGDALGIDIPYPQSSFTDMVHSAETEGFYRIEVRLESH